MKNISRKMSYLLRHNPEDLIMDKEGWVDILDLREKVNISMSELEYIVETNDKKRFVINKDKTKIRAAQGHSQKLKLNVKFEEVQFPKTYYHGTDFMVMNMILKHGLKPQSRSHVHLSKDIETAVNVGQRHGSTVIIFEIDGNQMKRDGYKIYISENGVILVDSVPPKYIKLKD